MEGRFDVGRRPPSSAAWATRCTCWGEWGRRNRTGDGLAHRPLTPAPSTGAARPPATTATPSGTSLAVFPRWGHFQRWSTAVVQKTILRSNCMRIPGHRRSQEPDEVGQTGRPVLPSRYATATWTWPGRCCQRRPGVCVSACGPRATALICRWPYRAAYDASHSMRPLAVGTISAPPSSGSGRWKT